MRELDYEQIQGIILSGYGKKEFAAYLLVRIESESAGKGYLRWLEPHITTGEQRPPHFCYNLALTASGLRALGVAEAALATFPREFVEGMAGTAKRSQILGDIGVDAPVEWLWGGPHREVDLLVMLFATSAARLNEAIEEHVRKLGDGVRQVYLRSTQMLLERREHFGFVDSITQPQIKETGRALAGIECLRAGEFILGYENEYRKLPLSPSVESSPVAARLLPESGNGRRDLGRNGSYVVVRQIDQHVAAFWRHMRDQAGGDAEQAVKLAAKCVGRWPGGAPLSVSPERDDPALHAHNDFMYREHDADGRRCPVGAHIRRANPRDSLGSSARESLRISSRHAIIRRGRSYGPALERFAEEQDEQERGLFFMCVNANIARQFEFIQQTWLNNPKFSGLHEGRDPLLGEAGLGGNSHRIPAEPVRRRLRGMPRFTRVRGGGYFFLPSRAALRFLAAGES